MTFIRQVIRFLRKPQPGSTLQKSEAVTTEDCARRAAESAVRAKGLLWHEPISTEYRHSPDGNYWLIQTNWTGRDHRIIVTVDDATGTTSRVQSHGRKGQIDHGP
jgi:hypothetical protein